MMKTGKNIKSFSKEELEGLIKDYGQPAFRGRQIHEWLWKKNASSFEEMTNIPKDLRDKLTRDFSLSRIKINTEQKSSDGTIKYGFKLHDGEIVEGVLIPSGKRMTACISSQVGCSLTCSFCATGSLDRIRNLDYDEIFGQVALINEKAIEEYDRPLTNIVYMGMGEPLLNFANVVKSIRMISSPEGLAMSPRRITVSTVGLAKMIKKLADEDLRVNFALSLHAANEEKRKTIMPITESNSLPALKDALIYYHETTGTRITYEYALLRGFNDSLADARELADFCKITPCKVNLIEYNPVSTSPFKNSMQADMEAFEGFLKKLNMVVNVRRSRGKDIDAACGQLANKEKTR